MDEQSRSCSSSCWGRGKLTALWSRQSRKEGGKSANADPDRQKPSQRNVDLKY
jgi:hypothetical protein